MNADEQERIMKQNDKDYDDWVCVVRCKDCKYFLSPDVCNLLSGLTFPTSNSYCNYGERKDK